MTEQVRLVGGDGAASGRVEIYHNNVWGTICHTDWTATDSDVLCRQLGYARSLPQGNSNFLSGTGQVNLNATLKIHAMTLCEHCLH